LIKNINLFTKMPRKWAFKVMPTLNKFWDVNFFFSNVLIPMVVLAFYCGSFAYFSGRLLPDGVNYVFVSRLWKYVLFLVVGMYLTFFVLFKLKKGDELAFKNSIEKLFVGDFLLLLLPLTPVVQYIINNQDIVSPIESLSVLVFFVIFSSLYIFVIPVFLSIVSSTRILMILGLAFVFTITNMVSLSHYYSWFGKGSLKIQLLFFGGVFLLTWLLYNLNNKKILYLLIVVNFATNSTIQLLSRISETDEVPLLISENRLLSFVEGEQRMPAVTPNIYLLIYDAYVPNETMLAYGIDNSSQEDYLKDQGFELYPHTYSVGANTLETMSKVLNASNRHYGNVRRGVSGNGIIQNILRDFGYTIYGVFPHDYLFQGIGSSYDFSIPERESSVNKLLNPILVGEFRFELGFTNQPREQFIESKGSVLEGVSGDPVFIYMHSDLPSHSQNSGVCLPDETDLFEQRLTSANIEMRQDIKTITENDPEAIVIVAGDHGPQLTKNCRSTKEDYDISEISRLDIQDRFGTFLAIRWPTKDFAKYDDIIVLQDLFPAIFAYLFSDERILESKIEPSTTMPNRISGASVQNGIIYGGINDGEPLFMSGQ